MGLNFSRRQSSSWNGWHFAAQKERLDISITWRGLGFGSTGLTCSLVLLWITSALSYSVLCIQVDCLRGMQFFGKADSAGAQGDSQLEWTQWLESDWLPSSCEAGTVRLSEERGFCGQGFVHRDQFYHQAHLGVLNSLNQAKWQPQGPPGRWLKQEMPLVALTEICVKFLKGNNSQILSANFCFSELLISMFSGCSIFKKFLPYNNIMRKPIPHCLVS